MRKGRREIGSNVSIVPGERLNQVHFQYHRINQDLRLVRIRYLECVYLSSYRHYSLFFLWPLSYVTAIAPPYPDANTLGERRQHTGQLHRPLGDCIHAQIHSVIFMCIPRLKAVALARALY